MVVTLLSVLISTPDGGEKRQVWLRRPGACRGTCARVSVDQPLSHIDRKWYVGQRWDLKDSS